VESSANSNKYEEQAEEEKGRRRRWFTDSGGKREMFSSPAHLLNLQQQREQRDQRGQQEKTLPRSTETTGQTISNDGTTLDHPRWSNRRVAPEMVTMTTVTPTTPNLTSSSITHPHFPPPKTPITNTERRSVSRFSNFFPGLFRRDKKKDPRRS